MDAGDKRLIARPGNGLLARFGGVVLLLARADDPAAEDLIAAARQEDAGSAIDALFQVVRKRGPARVAAFCALVHDGHQWTLAIHGEMEAVAVVNGSPVRFAGRGAGSRVEEPIPEGASDVAAGDRRPKLGAEPLFDLVAGVVPAGSFQLTAQAASAVAAAVAEPVAEPAPPEPAPAPEAVPEPVPVPEAVAEPEPAVSAPPEPAVAAGPDETAEHAAAEKAEREATVIGPPPPTVQPAPAADVRQALTIAYQAMSAAPEHAQPPEVEGRICALGHLNHPAAATCWICGGAITEQTGRGPRPPLGRLTTKDKRNFIVDGDFVIGRRPEQAEDVAAGRARPIEVAQDQTAVSRVHAEIRVQGWDVVAIDLGSANGTYFMPPGGQWIRMQPHQPVPITNGTTLTLGGFELILDAL